MRNLLGTLDFMPCVKMEYYYASTTTIPTNDTYSNLFRTINKYQPNAIPKISIKDLPLLQVCLFIIRGYPILCIDGESQYVYKCMS